MMKIKDFIKGFFKKEYKVELRDKPIDISSYDIMVKMKLPFAFITNTLGYYPISDITYGIRDYGITKVENISIKNNILKEKGMYKSFTKVSNVFYEGAHRKEINVKHIVFFMGLDNEIWKFECNPYFIYTAWNNKFDNEIIELCGVLSNGLLDALEINVMVKGEINVDSIYDLSNMQSRHFEGSIKTYGDIENYSIYNLSTELPDNENIDSLIINGTIENENKLSDYIKDESLIVDILRKEGISMPVYK